VKPPAPVSEILKGNGDVAVQKLLEKKITGLSYKSFDEQRKELRSRLNFELLE
jgi:hypothetical protein